MADQDSITPGNGSGDQQGGPQVAVLHQYLKDLSVEIPNAPQVFQWQQQAQLEPQINLNVNRVSDDVHEVVLKLEIAARSESGVQFLVDLSYAGLFGVRGLPEEALAPFLFAEAPALLFPFARQIVADATQKGGFPPLMLDPIDFSSAFLARLQAQQAQQENGGAGGDEQSSTNGTGENPES